MWVFNVCYKRNEINNDQPLTPPPETLSIWQRADERSKVTCSRFFCVAETELPDGGGGGNVKHCHCFPPFSVHLNEHEHQNITGCVELWHRRSAATYPRRGRPTEIFIGLIRWWRKSKWTSSHVQFVGFKKKRWLLVSATVSQTQSYQLASAGGSTSILVSGSAKVRLQNEMLI